MPKHLCSVNYCDLDNTIKNCLLLLDQYKKTDEIHMSKTDILSAFRLVPLKISQFQWCVMKAKNPITGEVQYFVDKCLPFGASRSCAIFQSFSNALKFIMEKRVRKNSTTNYLDDFHFIAINKMLCNHMMNQFLHLCRDIKCPISMEKTVWVTQLLTFLGLLIDSKRFIRVVPEDKKIKVLNLLQKIVQKKKLRVKTIQALTATLNFLSRAVVPGRAFTRRMYTKVMAIKENGSLKAHHHVSLDAEFLNDCRTWEES